jgi:hypothetical protein
MDQLNGSAQRINSGRKFPLQNAGVGRVLKIAWGALNRAGQRESKGEFKDARRKQRLRITGHDRPCQVKHRLK